MCVLDFVYLFTQSLDVKNLQPVLKMKFDVTSSYFI